MGRAVGNIAAAAGQGFEEGASFVGKGMLAPIAGAIQPPDLPRRGRSRQRMEHCQQGSSPDAGTQKNNGSVARPKREAAPCRAGLYHIANLQLIVDVSAGGAVQLPLDADPIALGARLSRERIAAHQGWRIGCW